MQINIYITKDFIIQQAVLTYNKQHYVHTFTVVMLLQSCCINSWSIRLFPPTTLAFWLKPTCCLTDPSSSKLISWLFTSRAELIRKLIENIPAKPRNHGSHGFLILNFPLLKVKWLIFTNFGGTGFMFNASGGVLHLSNRTF